MLVEVVRGGLVESVHRGRWVITHGDGSILDSAGAAQELVYPRSTLKPFQLLAMVRHGLDLEGELLALSGASHSGEQIHRGGVEQILRGCGLGVADLQNTPDLPWGEQARNDWLAQGQGASSLTQNCSGKHAAMLRSCVLQGWPIENYLELEHPLQLAVRAAVAELCGAAELPSVDGCGAPLFATTLAGLASGYGRLAGASEGLLHAIADAYRSHPEFVSGEQHPERRLHAAVPGLIAKSGAEGFLALGLSDGRGVAIKVDDGNPRGLMPVAVALLRRLGVAADQQALSDLATSPVLGHGEPVGQVRIAQDQ